ncbi:hypothetical protein COE58_09665 [Bacillus cereus]|nr:hypothetical protein COE58_09665 [Bacillus cereus]
MQYYNGGFMIISDETELIYQTCISEGLPSIILTISNSVRPTFPDYWFSPWCNTNENAPKLRGAFFTTFRGFYYEE